MRPKRKNELLNNEVPCPNCKKSVNVKFDTAELPATLGVDVERENFVVLEVLYCEECHYVYQTHYKPYK